MKDRIIYREAYKKGTTVWEGVNYPTVPHIKPEFQVTRVDILAQGTMQLNDEEIRFQDVRIYVVSR